jgi:hypothetical protein
MPDASTDHDASFGSRLVTRSSAIGSLTSANSSES